MPNNPDQQAIAKALDEYQAAMAIAGDRRAFDLLYRRWHPRLYRLALYLTRNREVADDVMQEAAITIARNIGRLKDPEKFAAWAYTIVRRRAADTIRSAIKDRKLQSRIDKAPIPAQVPDAEITLTLNQALASLSETDRTLLTLFYIDGLTGPELASALGIALGTVKSRLFSAREKLKTHYTATTKETDHD